MQEITVGVDGMMCGMCESHVNDAVRAAFPTVKKVSSSHGAGKTVIVLEEDIPDEKIVLHGNCTKKYLKDHPNAYWILGCPPNEPTLYLTVQRKEVINGMGDQEEEIIRPCMARDAAVWRDFVFKAADKYYEEHPDER